MSGFLSAKKVFKLRENIVKRSFALIAREIAATINPKPTAKAAPALTEGINPTNTAGDLREVRLQNDEPNAKMFCIRSVQQDGDGGG